MWVFDLDESVTWWANEAGLQLFDADSLPTLQKRQRKDPMSDGMRRRLATYREHFIRDEHVVEDWTFYPDDREPVTASCACSGVTIVDDGRERLAMLVEATPIHADLGRDERRLVEALRHCNERISLYREDGIVLLRNPAAEQALGLVPGVPESEERSFERTLVHPREAELILEAVKGGRVFQAEVQVRTTEGEAWYDTEARPVVDPVTGRAAMLCMQHDVSARRTSEMKLAEALREADALRAEAEAASRAKSSFLAMMSHELRTPMTGALAAAAILGESELTDDQRELLAMVQEGGHQMVGLVDDVLDLSRIEAGHVDVAARAVDPGRVLLDALRPLVAAARRKGLVLEHELIELPRCVSLDPKRFSQIVSNLVSNAIKFTDEGRVTVCLRGQPGEAPRLRLEVSDEGIGLEEADVARLFEPFKRGRSADARERGGAGLGLYIVHSMTDALGGQIGVESELGVGTRFWVEVPAPPAQPASVPSSKATAEEQLGLAILVVDDNRLNRKSIARLLRRWGCTVTEAIDGVDALERIDHDHDAVLMDVNMPRLDGSAAAAAMRQRALMAPNAPIVALTADVFYEHPKGTFDALLTKPVDWDALRRLLKDVFAKRHPGS